MTTGQVLAVINGYPPAARKRVLALRDLLLAAAAANPAVGEIEETLKWQEPAYLTSKSRSGTTVRIAWKAARPDEVGVFVHCQTSLVDTWRTLYPELTFDGNRAIRLPVTGEVPGAALEHCMAMALTYHRDRRAQAQSRSGA